MDKLTVIIPVYNASSYIVRCLQSVEAQTLQDVEVILVDDHGEDDSIEKAKVFVAESKRKDIHYVFIETSCNSGPAMARNLGIQKAQGEYIAFLDADDWIEPNMYEVLYANAEEFKADLSCCNAILDYGDGHHGYWRNPKVPAGELTQSNRRYLLRNYVSNFTAMLLHREWLLQNGIVFPPSRSGEDSSFVGQCYLACRIIVQTDNLYYHYQIHPDSLSHQKHVYRGQQKRTSFRALIDFAREKELLSTYRWTLYWIYFKKAIATAIIDYAKGC